MKKFLAVLLLLSCCIFFSCGKSPSTSEYIMLSLVTTRSGQIVQSVKFSVGSQKLLAGGVSNLALAQTKDNLTKKIDDFRKEYLLSFLLTYTSKPDPDFQINKTVFLTEAVYQPQTDSIGFDIIYASPDAWNFYHGGGSQPEVTGTFVIKSASRGVFPFSAEVQTQAGAVSVGTRLAGFYTDSLPSGVKIDYHPDLIYNYATPYGRLHSNCDYSFPKEGLNYHVWLRKEGEDAEIVLFTNDLNLNIFIPLILGGVVAFVAVSICVIKLRERKKKTRGRAREAKEDKKQG